MSSIAATGAEDESEIIWNSIPLQATSSASIKNRTGIHLWKNWHDMRGQALAEGYSQLSGSALPLFSVPIQLTSFTFQSSSNGLVGATLTTIHPT